MKPCEEKQVLPATGSRRPKTITTTNMYQDSRRIMANYFKMAKGLPVDRVEQLMWVWVYDKVRATGMEYFSAHADSLLKEVNVLPHPGMFGMVGDAMGADATVVYRRHLPGNERQARGESSL